MVPVLNYYAGGNTARGFTTFYHSNCQGLERIYSLNGGSNVYKTKLLKGYIAFYSKDHNIEIINSAIDPEEIEAVIVRDLKFAIINGTPIHESVIPCAKVSVIDIDLDESVDKAKIISKEKDLAALKKEFFDNLKKGEEEFFKGLKVHDEWETFYISNMDFNKADSLTKNTIDILVNNKQNGTGIIYDRYLGAATPYGSKDYVPNITEGVKRYFVKGRPGTGKSTMLKKIAKAVIDNGYDAEVYHCGFDPNSLDMVISRDLNFAIFDSTAPHEYFPDRPDDEIIDNYKELVVPGTDEKYENEFNDIVIRYKAQIKRGTSYLYEAKLIKDKIDAIYTEAFDEVKAEGIVSSYLPE